MLKFLVVSIIGISFYTTHLKAKDDTPKEKPRKSVENWYRNQTRRPASVVVTDYYILKSDDFNFSPTESTSIHKQYTCSTIASGQGIPESALEPKQTKRTAR